MSLRSRYTIWYLLLFEAALVQYFATAGASPGYLIDARRAFNEANMRIKESSASSKALTCSYCSLEQLPRSKHCQECDKCVLQLDHHCVWLGTCIGQKNRCRFWWKDVIVILLLCGLLIILLSASPTIFSRGIPERVYHFSKGIRQNLYRFCCARGNDYYME